LLHVLHQAVGDLSLAFQTGSSFLGHGLLILVVR